MTIRNLEIFVEVCRTMNMSQAAESLMISQSSVSQAVLALEKEFQLPLFERLNHKLYLTPAGKKMIFLCRQVLQSIRRLEKNMEEEVYQNPLRLGVCTTVGDGLVYPLIEKCQKKYGIQFLVEVNNSKYLEKEILNAKMDIAVVPASKTSPYLDYLPFLKDEMVLICWKGHALEGKTVPLVMLEKEGFVAREKGSGTERLLEQIFAESSLHLKKNWVCNNPVSVKEAVKHQKGIALVSKYLVQNEIKEGLIGEIIPEEKLFIREFVLAWHKDKVPDENFQNFLKFCSNLGEQGIRNLFK